MQQRRTYSKISKDNVEEWSGSLLQAREVICDVNVNTETWIGFKCVCVCLETE